MSKIPDKKTKQVYYKRSSWEGQKNTEYLETFVKVCHDKYKSTALRTFKGFYGSEMKCAKYDDSEKDVGIMMQIASYVPDQPTSVIEKSSNQASEASVDAIDAPPGKDYLDGDVFILINKNDVILLPSGAREKVALHYLIAMLKKNDFDYIAGTLEFQSIANEDKVRLVKKEGVKSIELNASLYEASLMYIDRKSEKSHKVTKLMDVKGKIAEHLRELFAEDESLRDIKEKENVNIKLSISFDGREAMKHQKDKTFGEIGKSRLQKTSEKALSEAMSNDSQLGGFTIVTGAGNKIRTDEIIMSEKFRIKTLGKSLFPGEAFKVLKEYYDSLKARGVLSK
nr:hypothetical protein [uncultured Desulfobacter sp.]